MIEMLLLRVHYRLTAVYAVAIGFYATLFKFFDVGPTSRVGLQVRTCADAWWRNFAYMTNLEPKEGQGIFQVKIYSTS